MSEAKDEPSNKVPAMLVMADSCRVAAEEGIADYLQGRVRVGGHPAGVSSKTEMAVNKVLQASAQAETKVGPIRSSAGIELMRKTQTAGTANRTDRSEEHTSELQSHLNLVCRLLLQKK